MLTAIPLVFAMATFSNGTTPEAPPSEIQFAVAEDIRSDDAGEIQQVVGKQPTTRKTRPGLLEVLTGSKQRGDRNHRHENMSSSEPRGLLDSLFAGGSAKRSRADQAQNGSKHVHNHNHHNAVQHDHSRTVSHKNSKSSNQTPAKSTSHRHSATPAKHGHSNHNHSGHSPQTQQSAPAGSQLHEANWDGIPVHGTVTDSYEGAHQPIRDPAAINSVSDVGPVDSGVRIIRGGSSRSVKAQLVGSRKEQSPATTTRGPAGEMGGASQIVKESPRSSRVLSTSSSSRRTGRRTTDTFSLSEFYGTDSSSSADEEGTQLVPREAVETAKTETLDASEAESTIAAVDVAGEEVVAADTPATPAQTEIPTVPEPAPATALAGTPPVGEQSTTEAIPAASPVPAPIADQTPVYIVPIDPSTSPVPLAGIPDHPYAASIPRGSIPATAASHRAGPPADAFEAAPLPYTPRFNAAATPVGSGVVPGGDVASFRHPAQNPTYQSVGQPQYNNGFRNDPYASAPRGDGFSPSRRLTTSGQPTDGRFGQGPSFQNNRPPYETATALAQPDDGYRATTAGEVPNADDNFASSTYDSRNQMRDGDTSTGLDSSVTTSELPGIRVLTYGPREIMIRQNSKYEIRVENRGSVDAEGVLIRAMVPDWADLRGQNATLGSIDLKEQGSGRQLVWTIDHLPAGSSEKMFVNLQAARSGTHGLDVDWTLMPQKSVAQVHVHEPRLEMSIEGPEQVIFGQSQTYKVRVLNPGDGTAPNVVFTLSPNSATPQTQRIGDIPPGKEAQFDVELTAQDLGDLKIQGLATGDLELRAEASKTIQVAASKLEATLTGPEVKYQNSDAMYALMVTNTGQATSERIVATLRMPSGAQYKGGIDEAQQLGNALRWEINALPPGASRNYQFQCTMSATGDQLFAFDCAGTAAGNTSVTISTKVESISDLVLTVNDPPAPAPIGSEVTYEIIIRNRGSKEARDVRAVAQFSHGIEPARAEGHSGEIVTGQVLFDPIPRIGAGQEVRLRVIATAARAGHHRFRSEVRSGDTVLVAEEATHYMSANSERVSRHSTDSVQR